MEQNLPIIAKKFWNIVRVAYFMLRKGISKAKLLADLNITIKRSKLAGKAAMHNLIFNHHHHATAVDEPKLSCSVPLDEYEFNCKNTPVPVSHRAFRLPFHLSKRKHTHSPPLEMSESELVAAAMEVASSVAPSPALPGFGRTPMVRQLRITDSPFPVNMEEDHRVDEAAEKFIMKFYKDLKMQNGMAS